MASQVQRHKNVFVPEDVDPLAAGAERRVDGAIVEYTTVIERAHPRANPLSGCEATELDQRRRHSPLTFFLPCHRCASLLPVGVNQSGHSPLKTSSAGPVMKT